ncbi:DNA-directed RNA polymerase subunit L [Candidatus Woesearchaeota archaeon]|nr:DNA-directed RNA polymerase subunit L [Candidatus Woesearchaeota archaeon]MBW3022005.1 DNA-directed RNA polymerase subunit L [Candidatus Woesearchaeota archaeon]
MELSVLEEGKNKIIVEIKGEDHTFCNLLRKELWNDSHVKAAAYAVDHPQTTEPKMIVETDGKEDPKKALTEAAKRIKKDLDKFLKSFAK